MCWRCPWVLLENLLYIVTQLKWKSVTLQENLSDFALHFEMSGSGRACDAKKWSIDLFLPRHVSST